MLKVKKSKRCAFPPIGRHISPPGPCDKLDLIIPSNFISPQLRPDGARQPTAEANVLSRMKAVALGLTWLDLDPIGR